jgi:glycosyltransferase involved in cell wall biosynthesis
LPAIIADRKTIRRLCFVAGHPVVQNGDKTYVSPCSLRLLYSPSHLFRQVILPAPPALHGELDEAANRVQLFKHMQVRLLPAPKNRLLRWLRQWPVLWRCIGESDVVCANIPEEASFLSALICTIRRKRLLVQVLGDWAEAAWLNCGTGFARRLKTRSARFMAGAVVRSADLIFTQGQDLAAKCERQNPGAVKSAFVHSNVTDDAFFSRNFRAFHDRLRLLSVCTLEPRKGLHVLARSVRILLSRGIKVEWWCVGRGPMQTELPAMAASLGISDSVRFLGYVPHGSELFRLYREADVFVLPSFHEGIPHVILEAMANSMPIVSTTVGSIPEVITDGIEGILLAPGDPESLAQALQHLVSHPEIAARMGKAAFQKASQYEADALARSHRVLIETAFGKIDSDESPRELFDSSVSVGV